MTDPVVLLFHLLFQLTEDGQTGASGQYAGVRVEWESKIESGLVPTLLQNMEGNSVLGLQGKGATVTQGDDVQVGNCLLL